MNGNEFAAKTVIADIAARGHVVVDVPLTLPDGSQGVGYAAVAPDLPAPDLAALGRVMEAAVRMDANWTEGKPRR